MATGQPVFLTEGDYLGRVGDRSRGRGHRRRRLAGLRAAHLILSPMVSMAPGVGP